MFVDQLFEWFIHLITRRREMKRKEEQVRWPGELSRAMTSWQVRTREGGAYPSRPASS